MHSNGTLPLDVLLDTPIDARCDYVLRTKLVVISYRLLAVLALIIVCSSCVGHLHKLHPSLIHASA